MHIAACSERGTGYGPNQDATCAMMAKTSEGSAALVVVCDGVGGLESGERASATVVSRFVQWFAEGFPASLARASLPDDPRLGFVERDWRSIIAQANADLRVYGKNEGSVLGTTFSGVLCMGKRYLAGHVGDCRILKVGEDDVAQISDDQTLLALKLSTGRISSVREACPGDANTILQAIGAQSSVCPRFYCGDVLPGEKLALCCDGAWRTLGNQGVAAAFREQRNSSDERLLDACHTVVRRAMERGETDNITVGCVAVDAGGEDSL